MDARAQYVHSLFAAADAKERLGDWQAARVHYLALLELPPVARAKLLTAADLRTIGERLARPEVALAGLCRRERGADGRTQWKFEEVAQLEHDAPVNAQTDARSVCPVVKTPADVLDAALQLANVSANDLVADLGCGDGRLLLKAAQRGARAIGFDVNPWCLEHSRAAAANAGCSDRVEVVEADICELQGHARFEAASVVYVYLIPKVIARIEGLLKYGVRRGKRVVVYCRTGNDRERPGNAVSGLTPAAEAMGGLLRLYSDPDADARGKSSSRRRRAKR